MPMVLIGAVAGALGVSIPTAGVIVSLALTALTSALSFGLQALLAPSAKTPTQSRTIDNLKSISRNSNAPARVVYGTTRLSGVLCYAVSTDETGNEVEDGGYLHVVLALAEGPVADITAPQLNNDDLSSHAVNDRFRDLVTFIPMLGWPNQRAVSGRIQLADTLVNIPAAWTRAHRLRGIAYVYGLLKHHIEVFPSGAPNLSFLVRGRVVYDPRDPLQSRDNQRTWQWSDNPALCILDYMTNQTYGRAIAWSEFEDDLATFIAAANSCDELVVTSRTKKDQDDATKAEVAAGRLVDDGDADQPYLKQKRYTCNGVFETDQKTIDVLELLKACCAGQVPFVGGVHKLYVGVPTAATRDLTDSDLRGGISILPQPSKRDIANMVRATFINAANNYQPDSAPAAIDAAAVKRDGIEIPIELDLPFTNDPDMAQRLSWIALRQKRLGAAGTLKCNMRPLDVQVWDVVRMTNDYLGWDNKKFRVTPRVTLRPGEGIDLDLVEYTDDIYALPNLLPQDPQPPTTLPSPFVIYPPDAVVAVETIRTNQDGTRVSAIAVTITPSALPTFVESYRITWRHSADAANLTQALETRDLYAELAPVRQGAYVVTVQARNFAGRLSTAVNRNVDVTFRSLPPPDVKAFTVETDELSRSFSWRAASELPPDFAYFELRYLDGHLGVSLEAEWDSARRIQRTIETSWETASLLDRPGDYTVYCKAFDRSGLESETAAFLLLTVYPRRRGEVIYREDVYANQWPGEVVGRRNSDGHLEPYGGLTWATAGTWGGGKKWASSARSLQYTHTEVDLGRDETFWPEMQGRVRDGVAHLFVRTKQDGGTWGEFHPATSTETGRYFQARVVVDPPSSAVTVPILERLKLSARLSQEQETLNDLDTAALRSGAVSGITTIRRTEDKAWLWLPGTHRRTRIQGDLLEASPLPMLSLNGSSQYATAPNGAQLQVSRIGCFEVTFRPTSGASMTAAYLFGKGTAWAIKYDSATTRVSLITTGQTGTDLDTLSRITVDPWQINTVSYVLTGQRLLGYLNGVLAVDTPASTVLALNSTAVSIGATAAGADFFNGQVCEARIWNVAPAGEQIRARLEGPVDPSTPGLVGYWRLNESSGATLLDSSSYLNHATATGSPSRQLLATRESPELQVGAVNQHLQHAVSWTATLPSGASIEVQVSADQGATWTTITSGQASPVLAAYPWGADLDGYPNLRLRCLLKSTTVANVPKLSKLETSFTTRLVKGEVLVIPTRPFARIDTATISAIQEASGALGWSIRSRAPHAVRFSLFRAGDIEDRRDAVVDVLLRGPRLPLAEAA